MTSTEVAERLGISRRRVTQAAPLYAQRHGKVYWWDEEAVEALRSRLGKVGRPPRKDDGEAP